MRVVGATLNPLKMEAPTAKNMDLEATKKEEKEKKKKKKATKVAPKAKEENLANLLKKKKDRSNKIPSSRSSTTPRLQDKLRRPKLKPDLNKYQKPRRPADRARQSRVLATARPAMRTSLVLARAARGERLKGGSWRPRQLPCQMAWPASENPRPS